MIIIAGTIDFPNQELRNQAIQDIESTQKATRDEEEGCFAYCFSADPCVPDRIQIYELWANESSLADHFIHLNYLRMRELLRNAGYSKSQSQKYRIDLAEPVYDENKNPRADFFSDKEMS